MPNQSILRSGLLVANCKKVSTDVFNISPQELDVITFEMVQSGEISHRERMPFIIHENQNFNGCFSRIRENPEMARNMMTEYKTLLLTQIAHNDSRENIEYTRLAISVLTKIKMREQDFVRPSGMLAS